MIAIALVLGFVLRRMDFGHWIYATGGHPQAARDMGIKTERVKTACFMLCATLAGLAGIIQSFRVKVIVPNLGTGLEMQAIAAAVIGGVALSARRRFYPRRRGRHAPHRGDREHSHPQRHQRQLVHVRGRRDDRRRRRAQHPDPPQGRKHVRP
jgi:hypothetical protein